MIHPGRILLEEFLAPKGISVWHLAKDIGVSARRIYEIVQGNARSTRHRAPPRALLRHVGAVLARYCRRGTISSPERCVCKDRVKQSD